MLNLHPQFLSQKFARCVLQQNTSCNLVVSIKHLRIEEPDVSNLVCVPLAQAHSIILKIVQLKSTDFLDHASFAKANCTYQHYARLVLRLLTNLNLNCLMNQFLVYLILVTIKQIGLLILVIQRQIFFYPTLVLPFAKVISLIKFVVWLI